jgi:uncharacterized protein (DUF924 family)
MERVMIDLNLIGRSSPPVAADEVLTFWFAEATPAQWFSVDPAFDDAIGRRFADTLGQAARGELADWRTTPRGRLAEIIVLDQFARNLGRGTPVAFALDPVALVLAQQAVAAGALADLDANERPFLLMPYMHSESARIHVDAETLFREHAPQNLDYETRHKAIVDRFGRYPHRNAILGRASTPEEIMFLSEPGSSF